MANSFLNAVRTDEPNYCIYVVAWLNGRLVGWDVKPFWMLDNPQPQAPAGPPAGGGSPY